MPESPQITVAGASINNVKVLLLAYETADFTMLCLALQPLDCGFIKCCEIYVVSLGVMDWAMINQVLVRSCEISRSRISNQLVAPV